MRIVRKKVAAVPLYRFRMLIVVLHWDYLVAVRKLLHFRKLSYEHQSFVRKKAVAVPVYLNRLVNQQVEATEAANVDYQIAVKLTVYPDVGPKALTEHGHLH